MTALGECVIPMCEAENRFPTPPLPLGLDSKENLNVARQDTQPNVSVPGITSVTDLITMIGQRATLARHINDAPRPSFMPNSTPATTIIIYDWDDTLLPSTCLYKHNVFDVSESDDDDDDGGGDDGEEQKEEEKEGKKGTVKLGDAAPVVERHTLLEEEAKNNNSGVSGTSSSNGKEEEKPSASSSSSSSFPHHAYHLLDTYANTCADAEVATKLKRFSNKWRQDTQLVEAMASLDTQTELLLVKSLTLGTVRIVTNADSGWVTVSAAHCMPRTLELVLTRNISIVSARSKYQDGVYKEDLMVWKSLVFKHEVHAHLASVVGDAKTHSVFKRHDQCDHASPLGRQICTGSLPGKQCLETRASVKNNKCGLTTMDHIVSAHVSKTMGSTVSAATATATVVAASTSTPADAVASTTPTPLPPVLGLTWAEAMAVLTVVSAQLAAASSVAESKVSPVAVSALSFRVNLLRNTPLRLPPPSIPHICFPFSHSPPHPPPYSHAPRHSHTSTLRPLSRAAVPKRKTCALPSLASSSSASSSSSPKRPVVKTQISRVPHVLSIGDALYERVALYTMALDPTVICCAKSVQFVPKPSVQELLRQQIDICAVLQHICNHPHDLDLVLSVVPNEKVC